VKQTLHFTHNLNYIRQWYMFLADGNTIGQQLVAQIPWGQSGAKKREARK